MDSSSEEQSSPSTASPRRRAGAVPRQRASRKSLSEKKATPAKTKVVPREPEPVKQALQSDQRKAPTAFASKKATATRKRKRMIIVAGLIFVGVGASAAIGMSDSGSIDVQQAIEARNERIRTNTANENDTIVSKVEIPVQDTTNSKKADGGLIGRPYVPPVPKPVEPISTSTATSSDQTSSSTESIASSTDDAIEVDETEEEIETVEE